MDILIGVVVGLLLGAGGGYFYRKASAEKALGSAELQAQTILAGAQKEAEHARREALVEAKDEVFRMRSEADSERIRKTSSFASTNASRRACSASFCAPARIV